MHIPTPNYYQKVIRKLNNIIIAQFMINKQPNILNNTSKFYIFAD